ncbi:MAG: hypothetical protein HYR62_07995 [Actinobacteria bacterium]|nr:hypothetical protein [Actinomycetota bacterium]MBI3687627.1 hypothetical protein [Actinomycetota bacterium]
MKRRWLTIAMLISALLLGGPPAHAAGARGFTVTKAQSELISAFARQHPLDLAGLDGLVHQFTGEHMQVSINGVAGTIDGVQAQRLMDTRWQERRSHRSAGTISPLSTVPLDAYTVAISWLPLYGPPPQVKAHGVWDFRDNYVNGSAPDDFANVEILRGCSQIISTTTLTFDYTGRQTSNAAYLQDGGLISGAPISGVRDRVSGFVMSTDHGTMDVVVQNGAGCGTHSIVAAFKYEHNQDGGSVLGVSAGWGSLSVSYSSVGGRLQKGTNPIYRTL